MAQEFLSQFSINWPSGGGVYAHGRYFAILFYHGHFIVLATHNFTSSDRNSSILCPKVPLKLKVLVGILSTWYFVKIDLTNDHRHGPAAHVPNGWGNRELLVNFLLIIHRNQTNLQAWIFHAFYECKGESGFQSRMILSSEQGSCPMILSKLILGRVGMTAVRRPVCKIF